MTNIAWRRRTWRRLGATALVATAIACAGRTAGSQASPRVRIDTDAGPIIVEVYTTRAPVTAANFLRYVTERRYDGGAFYRVVTMQNQPTSPVKIEVIQGGLDTDSTKRLPAIAHETNDKTGIRHEDGTISMARGTPGSASSEFFFCIGAQPELDFGGKRNPDGQGFAAFGKVVQGMDVVRRIQQMPADSAPPQRLRNVVRIRSIRAM
ncbi:MAG: peptidylprolyl isomerase [Gemmatimonadaceae bacterium]|nr:peptidylprolyl isomerase [Gemmatimonadaceae bacterium]